MSNGVVDIELKLPREVYVDADTRLCPWYWLKRMCMVGD